MIPFITLLLVVLPINLYATVPPHVVIQQQIEAEQGLVQSYMDFVLSSYNKNPMHIAQKAYPFGSPSNRNATSWLSGYAGRYIDHLYTSISNNKIMIYITYNQKPYTHPRLRGARFVFTASHKNKPLVIEQSNAQSRKKITSWQCKTSLQSKWLPKGPFYACTTSTNRVVSHR